MNIGIKIVERKPIVEGSPRLICGNSGDTITFTFDSEWSNYTAKVARFVYVKNGVVESPEVLFNGNVAEIPVLSNITEVFIGVYAGDLRTTTPVTIPCDLSILCKGGKPVDPTPDIYAQILDALNAKLILEGNASSATKLETPRTIQVDLENSNGASFDGTEDVTPGVIGVLPIENGGTGANTPEGVRDNLSLDTFYAPHAVKRVNGSAVAVNDSSNSPLANLKLYGKTEQDGTPTPDNPIELKSVGDSGSYEVGVYGGNLFDVSKISGGSHGTYSVSGENIIFTGYEGNTNQFFAFSYWLDVIPNTNYYLTLNSTSISVLYTYTDRLFGNMLFMSVDEDGKFTFNSGNNKRLLLGFYSLGSQRVGTSETVSNIMLNIGTEALPYESFKGKQSITLTDTLRGMGDIADEKDFARGVKTQKMGEYTVTSSDTFENHNGYVCINLDNVLCYGTSGVGVTDILAISNYFQGASWGKPTDESVFPYFGVSRIAFKTSMTMEEFKAFVTEKETEGKPLKILYRLATPIETPLTEEQLNAYRQLMTNKGTTTVLSEADLEVDYYTDTLSGETLGNLHSSLYSEIETLKQAIVSLGGEV